MHHISPAKIMDPPSFMSWAFHYTGRNHWKKARNVEFHTNTVKSKGETVYGQDETYILNF